MIVAGQLFFHEAWALSKHYFISEERCCAHSKLARAAALNLFQICLLVWLNGLRDILFNALQNYDPKTDRQQLLRFCVWTAIPGVA
jgi:ABC-type uncharacterized transport system fused permease/ATPase subunit